MKAIRIGIMAFTFLAMISISSAQTANNAKTKERTEKIISYLGLSDAQAVKARAISDKYFDLFTATKDANEKKKLNDQAEAEIKQLLTEDQYKKYRVYLTNEKNLQQGKSATRIPTPPRTAN